MSVMLTRELVGSLHLFELEKMFSSVINEDNCVRMYILADSMPSVQLKKDAFEVIKRKWEAVVKKKDFRDCMMNHPKLGFEITKAIYVEKSPFSYKPFWKATVRAIHQNPKNWWDIIIIEPDNAIRFIGYSVVDDPRLIPGLSYEEEDVVLFT